MKIRDRLAGGLEHGRDMIGDKIPHGMRRFWPAVRMQRKFERHRVYAGPLQSTTEARQKHLVLRFRVPTMNQNCEWALPPVIASSKKPPMHAIVFRAAKFHRRVELKFPAIGKFQRGYDRGWVEKIGIFKNGLQLTGLSWIRTWLWQGSRGGVNGPTIDSLLDAFEHEVESKVAPAA